MEMWHVLAALVGLAVGGTLLLGWRDGWLRYGGAGVGWGGARKRRAQHAAMIANANYVGIADIARFGAMRRRIGYPAAKMIMVALADRIAATEGFEVGRVGRTSIEFYYHAADGVAAVAMVTALRRSLEAEISVDAIDFDPSIIIGSTPVGKGQPRDELFDRAACAVEDAQRLPERICFVDGRFQRGDADSSAHMLHDLYRAVKEEALEIHYMPKLRLSDSVIVSAEALCRWTHRDHGMVSPAVFIKLAEETGLIGDLTLWTLDRVISDQRRLWKTQGITLDIDLNMSAQLICDSDFCDVVIARIAQASGRIGLEITETAVIADPAAALDNLNRISAAGIRMAIDDFGVGLSSLAYLRDLPADELKIDQTFVRALTTSHRDPLLVRSAIDIAHALEMEVTAEGVEDEVALALLKVMRCDNVQGYRISVPLPFDQLVRFLRSKAHLEVIGPPEALRGTLAPRVAAAGA